MISSALYVGPVAKFLRRAWLGGPTVAERQHRAQDLNGKVL